MPAIPLFFVTQPWVFPATLSGPTQVPLLTNVAWNIQDWTFR